ncbi:MAG: anthranilate phosphoribosyltransferase [Cyclobacteriaceae bacterium]
MKKQLQQLIGKQTLSQQEAECLLTEIGEGKHNTSQIAALLSIIAYRGITPDELAGFRDALLSLCVQPEIDGSNLIDIVGTGGDGKDTFNISTTSSFVVAGAGYQVAKHGNHGVSSSVGSSTVLEYLGIRFSNKKDFLTKVLDQAGVCFFHAPLFHPAMKHVGPARKELGVKTFFNMLGPLVNPIQPQYNLLGTYNLEVAKLYQETLLGTGKNYTVVHALDGYDEVSLTGNTQTIAATGTKELTPSDFGLSQLKQSDLYGGGNVEESAKLFLSVLANESTQAQQEVVLANAGLAIFTRHKEQKSLTDCVEEARVSIVSGKAKQVFEKLLGLSKNRN